MRVLVACEFSGTVRDAFARRGHDAWSCDLLATEIPGQHIQGDVLEVLNDSWDLMIAHPPCTYLSNAGVQHMACQKRMDLCSSAARFFNALMAAKIPRIAIENPIQHRFARALIRKYDQRVTMNHFGENAVKPTCLWLKGLPHIKPTTKPVDVDIVRYPNGRVMSKWYANAKANAQNRSKTFQGFAEAMADQWGLSAEER